jgi:hypothetical protein
MTAIDTAVSGEYERRFRELFVHHDVGGWREWEVREVDDLIPGVYKGLEWEAYMAAGTRAHLMRDKWTKRWSWAVPTVEALEVLADLAPLVEVGAGTGYWASLLRERGVDVQAFDTNPVYDNEYRHRRAYAPIARGDHRRALAMYPERTLLLCWAPYDMPMAAESLRLTRAERVVWVGEIHGCNGDDETMALLGEEGYRDEDDEDYQSPPSALFEHERIVDLPQWRGMHDSLHVYRRKGT